jgi:hypothetical protein
MSQYVTSKIHTTKKDIYVLKHNFRSTKHVPKSVFRNTKLSKNWT